MRRITDYCIESTIGLDDMIKKVNGMIRDGWQPQGWCTLGLNKKGNTEYNQSMVRYSQPKKNKIIDYCIIYSTNLENLIFKVGTKIMHEGWQPVGNCEYIRKNGSKKEFYQTVVRYKGIKCAEEDGE